LVWRDKESIGVEWQDVGKMAPQVPAAEVAASNGTESQPRDLELQNAELKGRIRALCKRLEDLGQDPNSAMCE
jgi:hypothetical protein